jgi:glycosyltransferase involved in cell wall biosynthesis
MRLLILGGSNSRNSGGVFDTARMMGRTLSERNHVDVEYLMFDDEYSAEDKKLYAPLSVHSYTVRGPRKVGFSTDIHRQLRAIRPDIVHTQSLWMYLSYANKKYHEKTGTPYIVSPHGMLDRWQLRQSFWKDLKKNIVLSLYERKHLKDATCFHALCKEEHDAIRSLGFKNPIAIIPNGIDLPAIDQQRKIIPVSNNSSETKSRKKLLFLGRIHHKKGLDNLLEAWWQLNPVQHDWQLVIAGETKDEVYMKQLRDKTNHLNISETVSFVGGQYGAAKHMCLMNSDAFILPSFSEGLPMSVLEAWSWRLPVLMTPYCNLAEGYEHNAAIHIEPTPESIGQGIKKVISMSEHERLEMGQHGFELVKDKFSWSQVANSMTHLYNWVLGKAEKPDFVFTVDARDKPYIINRSYAKRIPA